MLAGVSTPPPFVVWVVFWDWVVELWTRALARYLPDFVLIKEQLKGVYKELCRELTIVHQPFSSMYLEVWVWFRKRSVTLRDPINQCTSPPGWTCWKVQTEAVSVRTLWTLPQHSERKIVNKFTSILFFFSLKKHTYCIYGVYLIINRLPKLIFFLYEISKAFRFNLATQLDC